MAELPELRVPERPNKVSPWTLLFSGAVLLVVLVLVAFVVSWSFGWVGFEKHSPNDLYAKIQGAARSDERRLAALEWARQISENSDPALKPRDDQEKGLTQTLVSAAAQNPPDARFLSAIASLLGESSKSAAPASRTALVEYLKKAAPPSTTAEESSPEIFALLALAKLGPEEPRELEPFLSRVESGDASTRKAVAYGLGGMEAPALQAAIVPALEEKLLHDSDDDVRFNAAFSLVRRGRFTAALPLIRDDLQIASQAQSAELSPERFAIHLESLKAARKIASPELRELVKRIASTHPNLKLRQAAKEAVW